MSYGGNYGAPPGGPPPPGGQYGAPPPQQGYGQQQQYGQQHQYGQQQQGQYGQQQQGGYHAGGFNQGGGPPGAPPGADPQLWNWFTSVDTDRSGEVTAPELERALINGDWSPFDLDTVKLLMGIFDTDRSGTIGFNEFAGLWKYIKDWQGVFRHFDADRSGSIEGSELYQALQQFGYNLSPQLLDLVQKKYAKTAANAHGPPAGISFDRFVRACVVIKQLSEGFKKLDTDNDGWVQMNYEQFMHTVLSLP